MQRVLIHNNHYIASLLLALCATTSCLELSQELSEIPSILCNTVVYAPERGKPPVLNLNNNISYSHPIDLTYDQINIVPDTFFCIAQAAHMPTRIKKNGDKSPKDPTILFNYFVKTYHATGIEIVSSESRFEIGSPHGWHYYIFKSKDKKGVFTISLTPSFNDCHEKRIQVVVS